jgi:hypothetical protein
MMERPDRPQHLFVVRLWQEPSQTAPPGQWRGSAKHVASGEYVYFVALADLTGFIAQQIEPPQAPQTD